ncbi:hypothetical protein ABQE48_23230 [Mycolicibacterium thermoresistibile]
MTTVITLPPRRTTYSVHPFLDPSTLVPQPPRVVVCNSRIPFLAAALEAWGELAGAMDRGVWRADPLTGRLSPTTRESIDRYSHAVTAVAFPDSPEAETFHDTVRRYVDWTHGRATRTDVEEALERYLIRLLGAVPIHEAWRYADEAGAL